MKVVAAAGDADCLAAPVGPFALAARRLHCWNRLTVRAFCCDLACCLILDYLRKGQGTLYFSDFCINFTDVSIRSRTKLSYDTMWSH